MKIAIVSGSHRKESQSSKVAHHLKGTLASSAFGIESTVIDLGRNPLPLLDDGFFTNKDPWPKHWEPISKTLEQSSGLIVISPEWHGMVPAALKNFFLLCKPQELAHKPGLIVAVSSGVGGSYPVAELRSSSYKNNRLCFIPEHLIIRDVGSVLNSQEQSQSESDMYVRSRIDHTLALFLSYAEALGTVRAKNLADFKTYPNGM